MNLDKCVFTVYFRTIIGIVVSKEGKTLDLKKIEALIKMPVFETPQEIQVFNEIAQFYQCFINYYYFLHQLPSYSRKLRYLNGLLNVKPLGKT